MVTSSEGNKKETSKNSCQNRNEFFATLKVNTKRFASL